MDRPTQRQSIQTFLGNIGTPLSYLYTPEMEVQVNVGQDGGEAVTNEWKGKEYRAWTDGVQTWKPIRIPYNAKVKPEYEDKPMGYDLAEHAEAIGLTGWDWVNLESKWVAYDFDSIVGHSSGLTNETLHDIRSELQKIPWVTIRRSTSGNGLHVYVTTNNFKTENHVEHAALARAIIAKMSAEVNYDFMANVDICGGNMWVWHRRMTHNSFQLIKEGETLYDEPQGWRDHIKVVTGRRRRAVPGQAEKHADLFEQLCSQRIRQAREDEHKRHIKWLKAHGYYAEWNSDLQLLITHTYALRQLSEDLDLIGTFNTISTGKQAGDYNCFCFPLRNGGWDVRRFSPGCMEVDSWEQDPAGWTRCYLNRPPTLKIASKVYGGLESPDKEEYNFPKVTEAVEAARLLGADVPIKDLGVENFSARLRPHKDGQRIIFEIYGPENLANLREQGWLWKRNWWTKIFKVLTAPSEEPDAKDYDDIVRHIVNNNSDNGLVLKTEGVWREEPSANIKMALKAAGEKNPDQILGHCIWAPWKEVNIPFEPEYLSDRRWNRYAAQLRYPPSQQDELQYSHWLSVLNHIGSSLDEAIDDHPWCKANGIHTGSDYLKLWIASAIQKPAEPLPYLFLWGPQDSGKSTLHEALDLLLTKGLIRAEHALTETFNAELENSVFCVVEEVDMNRNKTAYNRIKDWVTSPKLNLHIKFQTPRMVINHTHWIQCGNESREVPVFPGDTRITMCYVPSLDPMEMIPKRILLDQLTKEAPDFVAEILKVQLPDPPGRLGIPVIETSDKMEAVRANRTAIQQFVEEECHYVPGAQTKIAEVFDRFVAWLPGGEVAQWSKRTFWNDVDGKKFPKGRSTKMNNALCIGNLAFEPGDQSLPPYVLKGPNLVQR